MLKQLSWISSGRLLATALQAITIVTAARLLEPAQLGQILAIVGAAAFAQMIFDLGVSTFVLRETSIGRKDSVQGAATIHALSCTAFVVFGIAALFVASKYSDLEAPALLPLAFAAAADRHSDMRLNILLAAGDSRRNVSLLLQRRLLTLILFLVLSYLAEVDPTFSLTASMAISSAIGLWCTIRATSYVRVFTPISRQTLMKTLKSSRSLWVNSMAAQLRNLDAPIVLLSVGTTASGLYGFASRLINPLRLVPDAVGSIFVSAAAKRPYELQPFIKISTVIIAAMVSGLICIIAVAPTVIPIVVGTNYEGAILPVQIISISMVFGTISSLCSSILIGWGETKIVAVIATSSNVLALVLLYFLSQYHGAIGAASGLCIAFSLQAIFLVIHLLRSTTHQ